MAWNWFLFSARGLALARGEESPNLMPHGARKKSPAKKQQLMNTPDPTNANHDSEFMDSFKELLAQFAEAKLGGNDHAADLKAMEAFALVTAEVARNPSPDLLLMAKADELESQADWEGAERVRREVLSLKQAHGNHGEIAKAHADLGRLFQFRGRLDEAWESALAATSSARRFGLDFLTAMMLEHEAGCALLRNDGDRALQALNEALENLEETRLTESMRSRCWVLRARCLVTKREWDAAEAALNQARALMGGDASASVLLAPIAIRAACFEVQAAIYGGRGMQEKAIEAWREAVAARRLISGLAEPLSPYRAWAVARALEGLSRALVESGRADEAQRHQNEAAALRHRAGLT
jgi:tetratricopeptide (TPR) repeat protein